MHLDKQQRVVVEIPTQVFSGIVDYAGLFPPAGLDMAETVRNYASYSKGPDAGLLARLVVPVFRLDEFADAVGELRDDAIDVWPLSVLVQPERESSIDQVARFVDLFQRKTDARVVVDSIETRASSASEIRTISRMILPAWHPHFEIPIVATMDLIDAIKEVGGSAKIRTGGLTGEAFPSSQQIATFIHACTQQQVRFKATAGLHHAVRCSAPFTYEEDSPSGCMHGFLNVLLAAALSQSGASVPEMVNALEEEQLSAFVFDNTGVRWNSHFVSYQDLVNARKTLFSSFGSCSFTEPVAEFRAMRLL
ncbi:MAG: hypothetical protein NVS9B4_24790 [Candidatus Acidiferrum sp.]